MYWLKMATSTVGENAENSNENDVVPGFKDVISYSKSLLGAVLKATKASNNIPESGGKYDFYYNFSGFRNLMRTESRTILDLMTRILQHQGGKGNFQHADLDDKFDLLVEANDTLMEKVGTALDEASGIKRQDEAVVTTIKFTKPINTSWNKKSLPASGKFALLAATKNVLRPQLKFTQKVDNSNSPFVPTIKYKPNSIKPLSILLELDENGQEVYSHPYEIEIEKFQPSEEMLSRVTPQVPKPVETTELIFVNTVNDLCNLCSDLSQVNEFAVDLEHHSYRSFQGITCLMQISTRTRDYIVDTLELRDELHQLNESFTNPKIMKVLHGADLDVQWLQRDCGVYLVNLFDTGQAARVLNYSHFSLAFLLKHFCQIDPDKSFQLADWRIRPLTDKMVLYARQDTHYLLYIYDCMKNELLDKGNSQKNLILSVFQRSKEICLKRYQKPIFRDDSYLILHRKSKKKFNTRQLYALKELYSWRDKICRTEDESIGFVLPNHMMLQIADMLPREQQGILALCNPIPPLVRQQLNELHQIILKAREWNEEKLLIPESHLKISESQLQSNIKTETSLNCPHDLPPQEEMSNLPSILEGDQRSLCDTFSSPMLKANPQLSAFGSRPDLVAKQKVDSSVKMRMKMVERFMEQMISPFQRFKLVEASSAVDDKTDTNSKLTPDKPVAGENDHAQRVLQHLKNLVSGSVGSDQTRTEVPSAPPYAPERDVGVEVANEEQLQVDEPDQPLINQMTRKRKRKSKRAIPDVPLSMLSETLDAQTQEKLKGFQSFDYEKAKETLFRAQNSAGTCNDKPDRKRSFDPNNNYFKNKRGRFHHKNRQGRSMTYGSTSQNVNTRQWPKR